MLSIYDLNGRVFTQSEKGGNASFDLTKYESEIYFLSVLNQENQTHELKRIIKE